jgi:hypothetical protein
VHDVTSLGPDLALNADAAADVRDVESPLAVGGVQDSQQSVTDTAEALDGARVCVGACSGRRHP